MGSAPATEPADLSGGDLQEYEAEFGRAPGMVTASTYRYLSRPRWWVEFAVIGVLYGVYSLVRNSVGDVATRAYGNGRDILALEDGWGLAPERWLNGWVHRTHAVADAVALHYATLHFLVTPAVLVWLFFQRPVSYRASSSVLMLTTALALIGFYWLPTAPPRLLGDEGFVDVMSQTSSWGWWPESGTPGSDAISNQFAAMPSLHCAWAVWCGVVLFLLARRTWVRVLALCYPLSTFFVVMSTGNHYLLDVVGGVVALAVGAAVVFLTRSLVAYSIQRQIDAGQSDAAPAGGVLRVPA